MVAEQEPQIPKSLIDELKAEDRALSLITARVDRSIADLAETQFSSRQPPAWHGRGAWIAAAAAAVLALFLFEPQRLIVDEQALIHADIDHSGRIDIADVLALARGGQVSQADLDAFAMRIVSLSAAGDSS